LVVKYWKGSAVHVQQIINSKATSDVITVKLGSLVSETAKILAERRIGAVVVYNEGTTVEGILSERDIVRELARSGAACLSFVVDKIMTKNPVTCLLQNSAEQVLQTMTEGRFRHMPVVENGKLIGLITLGDVVKARLSELAMEKDALEGMIKGF